MDIMLYTVCVNITCVIQTYPVDVICKPLWYVYVVQCTDSIIFRYEHKFYTLVSEKGAYLGRYKF